MDYKEVRNISYTRIDGYSSKPQNYIFSNVQERHKTVQNEYRFENTVETYNISSNVNYFIVQRIYILNSYL